MKTSFETWQPTWLSASKEKSTNPLLSGLVNAYFYSLKLNLIKVLIFVTVEYAK